MVNPCKRDSAFKTTVINQTTSNDQLSKHFEFPVRSHTHTDRRPGQPVPELAADRHPVRSQLLVERLAVRQRHLRRRRQQLRLRPVGARAPIERPAPTGPPAGERPGAGQCSPAVDCAAHGDGRGGSALTAGHVPAADCAHGRLADAAEGAGAAEGAEAAAAAAAAAGHDVGGRDRRGRHRFRRCCGGRSIRQGSEQTKAIHPTKVCLSVPFSLYTSKNRWQFIIRLVSSVGQ